MNFPRIHSNGSHPDTMVQDINDASSSLADALAAMVKVAPHMRDYYMLPAGSFEDAFREHQQRVRDLRAVKDDLEKIAENILEQVRAI